MSEVGKIEERIRERAYALWEQEGCLEGRAEEYWEQARQEFEPDGQEPEAVEPSVTGVASKKA